MEFSTKIGSLELQARLIVANITDEILLGADILMDETAGRADILLSRGKMILRGKTINLEQRFNPLPIRKVHLADTCIIPAESEVVTDVFLEWDRNDQEHQWVIKRCPDLAEKYRAAMAATLVDTTSNVTTKVRLMNPFKEDQSLPQDTMIGFASQAEQVGNITNSEIEPSDGQGMPIIRQIQINQKEVQFADTDSTTNSDPTTN